MTYFPTLAAIAIILVVAAIVALVRRRRNRIEFRGTGVYDAVLSVALLGFSMVALEGLFGLVYDRTDSFSMTNVSVRWFQRHVRSNSLGFRDVEFEFRRPKGVFRIVLIGDSFTYGHGIENAGDRFGDLIAGRLEELAPGKFQVYNLGVPGTDTPHHRNLLRLMARRGFECDLILLVYTPNDASPLLPEHREIHERIDDLEPEFWLWRDTYLFNFLYWRVAMRSVPEARDYFSWVTRAFEEPFWTEHRADLADLVELSEGMGIPLRVVIFPLVASLGPDYPLARAHEKLDAFWNDLGIPHLDLIGHLEGHPPSDLTVNRYDGHPGVLAHRIAADAIFEELLAGDPIISAEPVMR